MKENHIKAIVVLVIVSLVCFLPAQAQIGEGNTNNAAGTSKSGDRPINLVLDETSEDRVTGSVQYIDAERELRRDSRPGLGSAITGKVPGVFDTYNLWGTGAAVIVVDGVRQDAFYYQNLDMREVESIVVLKDAASKALYGAQGDQGVVVVNTKRGKAGDQRIRITGEYTVSTPRTLPNFLGAADYMEKYNEAQVNDGVDLGSLRYSQMRIDSTRMSDNRTAYPDNDFHSAEYLRNFTTNANIFADVRGGNESAQYYVNAMWEQSSGWLNTSIPDVTDRFGFRSNLDFDINQYLRMSVNANARLHFNEQPNAGNYWNSFGTILPNAYPVLWSPSLIVDEDAREMVLNDAQLVDGQVLGGSSSFANNQLYGELTQNGKTRYQQRLVQFGGTLDMDLSFITEGLTAKGYAGMNFYNSLFTQQDYEYAIYEPVINPLTGVVETVTMHGADVPSNRYNTNPGNSDSFRQVSFYGNMRYDRAFGEHDLSLAAVIYGDQITQSGQLQRNTLFHTGLVANYLYKNRYVLEASAMGIGSRKLAEGQRVEWAPSVGLGWILSREGFMDNSSVVDYLKVRGSYGISKNDNWNPAGVDSYFLHSNTFDRARGFRYYNGTHMNPETVYGTVANDIHLQQREDIMLGVDASLFNKALNVDASVFSSTSRDNITLMASTYPQLLGYQDLVYSNYNSDRTQGIDLGISYTLSTSETFRAVVGGNLLHIVPKVIQREEPVYEGADRGLLRQGTASDAMWGLVADGLYSEADFEPDGSLVSGLPQPTFGAVQPGDIKYLDQNSDGIINQDDQRIIGHGLRTQFSASLDVRYKNVGLYVLGVGRVGNSRYRSGSYFRVFGDVKYSEYALEAYGSDNQDVNAIHPRLSANSGGHSDRNSSFWVYKDNSFTLPVIQLTWYFEDADESSFLKQSQVYARATNALVLGKNRKYTEVNPYAAPATRSVVVGFITSL